MTHALGVSFYFIHLSSMIHCCHSNHLKYSQLRQQSAGLVILYIPSPVPLVWEENMKTNRARLDLLVPCCQETVLDDNLNVMLLVKQGLLQVRQGYR